MSQDPIIYEGFTLMALGMGFVFCFLCLLVGAIRVLTKVSSYFVPPAEPAPPVCTQVPTASNDTLVAAISAVLHHHKKKFS
ncbi:OadG family protein [Vibrio kyushuensis]|uniref:OadG family protein n=1 Tax=Vibrio TaxID=662 RepID=UPI003D0E40AF